MNTTCAATEQLCLETLAAVAWADAEVSHAEMASVVALGAAVRYAEGPRVQEMLLMPRQLPSSARLRGLDVARRVQLLDHALAVAAVSDGISARELDSLQRLARALDIEGYVNCPALPRTAAATTPD